MKTPKLFKNAISVATALFLASTLTTSKAGITDLVVTLDSLSFNFTGIGFTFIPFPASTDWEIMDQLIGQSPSGYGVIFYPKHLPDGTLGSLRSDPGFAAAPYGTTVSDTDSVVHGTGVDNYSFNITVMDDGSGHWDSYAGSFSATHLTSSAPDGGSTALMAGLSFLALAGARKFSRTGGSAE